MANVVNIKITADDQASAKLRNVEDSSKSLTQRLRDMRVPLLAVTAALSGVGIASVKFASDLDEARNKALVTFGDAAGVVEEFAATSAQSFGISSRAANEYAGTLGTILNASGLARGASADMSVELVRLAADLASFNNIPIDVALEKLRSGLVGEVEPLRTVGVLLNQAAVEAKAVELGLIEAGDEMTEQQKVQARYALIMEQTTAQQGDFARTSDGLANSMRIVKAQLEDVAAEVGQRLIPFAKAAVQVIQNLLNVWDGLTPGVKTAVVAIGALTAGLAALGLVLPPIITGIGLLLSPLGLVALAVAGVVAAGVLLVENWEKIAGVGRTAFEQVGKAIEWLANNIFIPAINGMIRAVNVFRDLIGKDAIETLDKLSIEGGQAFDSLTEHVVKFREKARAEIQEIRDTFNGMKNSTEDADYALGNFGDATDHLVPKVRTAKEEVGELFDRMKEGIRVLHDVAEAERELAKEVEKRAKMQMAAAFAAALSVANNLPSVIGNSLDSTVADMRRGAAEAGGLWDAFGNPIEPGHPLYDTYVAPWLNASAGASPAAGVVVNHYGDNYGIDDFDGMVAGAVNRSSERGASGGGR